jgi:2-C-methyl-D-erythritol 4-phosphate cytidylyltransferase
VVVKVQLLIPAAGSGRRLGCVDPKALVDIAGRSLLVRALERFGALGLANNAVIVVPEGFQVSFESVLRAADSSMRFNLIAGGAERQHSVENGLAALDPDTEIVIIHDAARPFVSSESISASIAAAAECGAATVAVPVVDTILVADEAAYLMDTPDRTCLWACQTPQTFRVAVIRAAHETARRQGYLGTDDATLVRRAGGTVKLVPGSPSNFKITTPMDLALARCLIEGGLP